MNHNYYLDPDSNPYRQGIFDVLRIFMPEFEWSEPSAEVEQIAVKRGTVQWTLLIGETEIPFTVESLDENQCRRKLKQAAYQYWHEQYGGEHPWGIMTGIRPTKIVHRYRDAGLSDEAIKQNLTDEYFLADEKADLLVEVTNRQRPFLLDSEKAKTTAGIYLSIPFCPTRCHYCSFPSFHLPKAELQELYLNNLLAECQSVGAALKAQGISVQTVYIGGGTPSSLSASHLGRLLDGVQQSMGAHLEEFTVEAGRPDTISAEKLQIMHNYGVDRISINPQTFSQRTLDAIGRKHTVQDIFDVYALARKIGFDSINMDLIAGLTDETVEDFQHSLAQISVLKPENLTVHTLAIKRTAKLARNDFDNAQAEIVTAMNRYLQTWLAKEAYVPYYLYRQKQMIGDMENTGFCLAGRESVYNIQMMEERQTVLGLGVGSTSKYVNPDDWTLIQHKNPKDLYFYNERIDEIIAKKIKMIEML